MMRILEHEDIGELGRYRRAWGDLLHHTPRRSFFQSLDWLQLYWRHFGQEQRLRVLVVEDQGQVAGILPLVAHTEPTRAGSIRVLTYPLHDWGSFYGPIGPHPTATWAACLPHLRDRPRDWDLLDVRWVNKADVDHGRTATALASCGFPSRERIWRTTAMVDFEGSWDEYCAQRSSKFRNNLRRAESLAAQSGGVSFERYRPCATELAERSPRWEYFDECLELAHRSWQGSSLQGTTISHPQVTGFFRELFGIAASAGALDVNLLRHQGRLIAFSFNLVLEGRLSGLRIGFCPELAGLSPGRLLLARSIADSFRRGDRSLDLGAESMPFKQQWLTRTVDSMHYTHYPLLSARSQLLRLKHWLWPAQGIRAHECATDGATRRLPVRVGTARSSAPGSS